MILRECFTKYFVLKDRVSSYDKKLKSSANEVNIWNDILINIIKSS